MSRIQQIDEELASFFAAEDVREQEHHLRRFALICLLVGVDMRQYLVPKVADEPHRLAPTPNAYHCPECGQRFVSERALRGHRNRVHRPTNAMQVGDFVIS